MPSKLLLTKMYSFAAAALICGYSSKAADSQRTARASGGSTDGAAGAAQSGGDAGTSSNPGRGSDDLTQGTVSVRGITFEVNGQTRHAGK